MNQVIIEFDDVFSGNGQFTFGSDSINLSSLLNNEGEDPLERLLHACIVLDEFFEGQEESGKTRAFQVQIDLKRESGGFSIQMTPQAKQKLEISFGSYESDLPPGDDDFLKFQCEYSQFREECIRASAQCLQDLGLRAYFSQWGEFPLGHLLFLLKSDVEESDPFKEELEIISQAFQIQIG